MSENQSVNVTGSGNQVVAHSTGVSGSNPRTKEQIEILLAGLQCEEGALTISFQAEQGWLVGLVFGQEDADSDMAAGASYGTDPSLAEALRTVVEETGWDRR